MAQFGSRFTTSRKACSETLYANECSSANRRSNPACTAGAHDVGKLTEPSFSGAACEWCSSSAASEEPAKKRARIVAARCFFVIAVPLLLQGCILHRHPIPGSIQRRQKEQRQHCCDQQPAHHRIGHRPPEHLSRDRNEAEDRRGSGEQDG